MDYEKKYKEAIKKATDIVAGRCEKPFVYNPGFR